MHIKEVTANTTEVSEAISRLLRQLTTNERQITESYLKALIASENSHLFVAVDDGGTIAGMITVGTYLAPTGRKGWIEDVVVDDTYRGRGLGKLLVRHAIEFAKQAQLSLLSLTSNPSRIAANQLYPKTGFSLKETNVYVMNLN
ncbi:GNAT family N-acetyltransferase [Parapedobacter deserti]|uniref:GNAT family N-acetyltransferase n=1 Tax=Parapedobacter deserti TaxID=1912957 RepID=A0ABV7JGH3_9SPHI